MADILLQPIHQMRDTSIAEDTQLSSMYLVVSQPSINGDTFLSYKISMEKVKNLAIRSVDESLTNKINAELRKFANTLSGTVSTALSNALPASKLVITDSHQKLSTYNNFDMNYLSCLSGCVGSIKATFDLISTGVQEVGEDLASKYSTLTTNIANVDTKANTIVNTTLPTVSSRLSTGIDISGNYLDNKIQTVKIDVDVIKEKYVDKDVNVQQHEQLSNDILDIVAEVSTQLSAAIIALSVEYVNKVASLQSDIQTNTNNIAFILDNLNIGVNMYETKYVNGSWQYDQIKDKHDNDVLGYLFKIDDPADQSRNEAVLMIGLATPQETSDGELVMTAINSVPGCSLDNDAAEVLDDVRSIGINIDVNSGTQSVMIDDNLQNVKVEQLMFLNVN